MVTGFAVTAVVVLHVGVIEHHVPCQYDPYALAVRTMRACARGRSEGPCRQGGDSGEAFGSPKAAGAFGALQAPQ